MTRHRITTSRHLNSSRTPIYNSLFLMTLLLLTSWIVPFTKGSRFSQSGLLHLQPYCQRTDTFSYLYYSSSHPFPLPHVSSGLVKGEMIRILRLSSSYLSTQNTSTCSYNTLPIGDIHRNFFTLQPSSTPTA